MTIRISDHAMLRFLERVGGYDVEQLRSNLAASFRQAHSAASRIGVSEYTIKADGKIYCVKGGVVTTVLFKSGDR